MTLNPFFYLRAVGLIWIACVLFSFAVPGPERVVQSVVSVAGLALALDCIKASRKVWFRSVAGVGASCSNGRMVEV